MEKLLGEQAIRRASACRVAIFGLGGVGGYVAEGLARAGIGALDLIDSDEVALSNLNRQILATHATLGRKKAEVAGERVLQIAPQCKVRTYDLFFLPGTPFDFTPYDYVVDAVDTVTAKVALAEQTAKAHVPLISCMGVGNRLDPSALQVTDLFSTEECPLARVMRHELRKRGIPKLKVLCSREKAIPGDGVPGSTPFVPSVAGLLIANEVFFDLQKTEPQQ